MGLTTFERENPRRTAETAASLGRLHDVVLSASKVIYGITLEPADFEVLRWAVGLLRDAGRTTHALTVMPAANELSAPADPVELLREIAAEPGEAEEWRNTLHELSGSLKAVLDGDLTQNQIEAIESIRSIFIRVSKMILGAEISAGADSSFGASWPRSTMNSTS